MNRLMRPISVLLMLLVVLLLPANMAYPNGIGKQADNGCLCHGEEKAKQTQAYIDGLPEKFEATVTYNLTLSMNSTIADDGENQGGFTLWHSAGEVISGEGSKQMEGRLTHTSSGNDQRVWNISWIAPNEDDIQVDFQIHVNAVDGNGESTGDAWSTLVTSISGKNFSGEIQQPDVPGSSGSIPFIGGLATLFILGLAARRFN